MSASLAVLGFGSMGSSLVEGTIRANLIGPSSILVIDPDTNARTRAAQLGCLVCANPTDAVGVPRIALAVKPQSFPMLAQEIGALDSSTLIISVMAGVTIARITEALGAHARCVRCMPNVAARIGLAMTAYHCGEGCTNEDRDFALQLLNAMGKSVEISEHMFDAVTATSGSGPAYVFLLAESMIDSAMRLGFDRPTADRLVRQTLLGAATLLAGSDATPADLRGMVTSQGGTTSAALAVLESHGFRSMMLDALRAARDRGRDLSQSAAKQSVQQSTSNGLA